MEEKKETFTLVCNDWCIDWPTTKDVEINDNEYIGYVIERRFGPSWWISGVNPIEEQKRKGRLTEFGEVNERNLIQFIKWAEDRIIEFHCITIKMNFLDDLQKILKQVNF